VADGPLGRPSVTTEARELGTGPEHGTGAENRLRRGRWAAFGLWMREAFIAYQRHQHLNTAALLAYYGCLSFVPLVLLFSVLTSRWVLWSATARSTVVEAADRLAEGLGRVVLEQVETLSQQRWWGVVSLAALLWAVTPFAASLRSALEKTFVPERPTGLIRAKLRDLLGALALVGALWLLVTARLAWSAAVGHLPPRWGVWLGWAQLAFSFIVAWVAFALLYRVFVPVRLRAAEWGVGSLLTAAAVLGLRPAFALFLRYNPNFGWAFGSLKAVFVGLTWIYTTFAAILFVAELVAAAHRREVALLRLFLPGASPGRWMAALDERFVRRVPAGEVIVREGDAGSEMFVVRRGKVEVRRGGRTLTVLREGEYFGELSLLLGVPRSATVVARTDVELVVIPRDHFDAMLREQPEIAVPLLKELAQRLRSTDDQVATEVRASNIRPMTEDENTEG